MEESEERISKYSSGVNIIIRLDKIWTDCHTHSRAGLFYKWNSDLDRVWVELARDIKEDDYEKVKKEFADLDKKIVDCGEFKDTAPEGFETISKEDLQNRARHYKALIEKELFLKRLENKLGKGTTWDDQDEDGFD